MSIKETILKLIDLIQEAEKEYNQALSDNERRSSGELHRWAPKEIITHTALWSERQLDNILRGQRGEPFINYDNYLKMNDQDFPEIQKLTWEEALQLSSSARRQLRNLLMNFDEQDFVRTDLLPSGIEFWKGIAFNWVEHQILHYSASLWELNKPDISSDLQRLIIDALMDLSPEDVQWMGTVVYNRACQHTLSGQKAIAIRELQDALRLAPSLTEWAKEDTDLAALREEAEYQAIFLCE